jgi:hypothetical protein
VTLQRLRSGNLAVYGIPTDARALAVGPPEVLIIDPAARQVVGQVILEGVRAGQLEQPITGALPGYEVLRPGVAWDLARDRLYATHPDGTAVTLVDLAAATSRTALIHQETSLLGQIQRWLAPSAHAKLVPETAQQAVLSDDGSRLYITGRRLVFRQQADGGYAEEVTFSGLRVLATDDLRELARRDLPVDQAAIAPGGQAVLLTGTTIQEGRPSGQGLFLLNAADLTQQARLAPDGIFTLHGFSQDGKVAYAGRADPGGGVALQAIGLAGRQVIAERALPWGDAGALLTR